MRLLLWAILLITVTRSAAQVHSLEFFIGEAKKNSPLFRAYQNQIQASRVDSQLLLASLKPQVNFISNELYAPVAGGWGYDNAITNTANVSAQFQARKDFISKNYLSSLQRNIRLQGQALQDTIALAEQELARTIAEQYITSYGDLQTMDLAGEILKLLKNEEEVLKGLTRANIFKQTDYLTFVVTMQQQELSYLQAQMTYQSGFLLLNYLAGISDTTVVRLEEPFISDLSLPAFTNSVFYKKYITDSLRIANEQLLIDYTYKPRLSLFADAGYNSSLQYNPYKNFGASAGLGLIVPIYDGKQKALKHTKLDIEEKSRIAARDFVITQYNQQVASLYQQLQANTMLVDKIKQQLEFTSTLIKADLKLLETGDIRIADLVLAINNYFNAAYLLRQNNISKLKILNQIRYWNR